MADSTSCFALNPVCLDPLSLDPPVGTVVGAVVGAMVGVVVGAMVGTLVGTVVGAMVGAMVGSVGDAISNSPRDMLQWSILTLKSAGIVFSIKLIACVALPFK